MVKDLLFPEIWDPSVDPASIPLEDIDMCNPDIFMHDAIWPLFER